jgi:hypothetical protein
MQNSFPKNLDVLAQQASIWKTSSGKELLENIEKYGEVRKDGVETGLSATSKMDSNKESASRRRHLSQTLGSFQCCSLSLG